MGISIKPSPFAELALGYGCRIQRRGTDLLSPQDYAEHRFSLRPRYELTPFTEVYLHLSAALAEPEKEVYGKTRIFDVAAGFSWRYRDIARLYAEAGCTSMSFSGGTIRDRRGYAQSPSLRLGGDCATGEDWRIGAEFSSVLRYGAESSDAPDSGSFKDTEGRLFFLWSPGEGRITARFEPYFMKSSPSVDEGCAEYGFRTAFTWAMTESLGASAGFCRSIVDYEGQSAYHRNVFTIGFSVAF